MTTTAAGSRLVTTPKILIVDDEALIRRVFLRVFKGEPYTVLDAAGVDEAIALHTEHNPIQVLITDVRLTGNVNGCQLARDLHQRQPSMRIIIISGDVPTTISGLEPGSYWTLGKPFTNDALKDLVKFVLGAP